MAAVVHQEILIYNTNSSSLPRYFTHVSAVNKPIAINRMNGLFKYDEWMFSSYKLLSGIV